ncbi:MAG: flagellar hook-basal body complex protein FliE [Litoreibacter sp.]|uniref:flagellar hook-basal body complex protein FliE n=1 Tax=Litoreibacter sp. TaxID=1969459 RepID=UPI003298D16B
MDISTSIAHEAYKISKPATMPSSDASLGRLSQQFADVVAMGENTAMDAMAGNADPHQLVEALTQSELAIQTAVSVRDKVVEAYQEILRMPV